MSIIPNVISASDAVALLSEAGVKISERTLRAKARRKGCYRQIGQAIFFLPADLEKLMEPETCSSQSNARTARIGSRGERSTGGRLSGQQASPKQPGYQKPAPNAKSSRPESAPVTPIPFRKES